MLHLSGETIYWTKTLLIHTIKKYWNCPLIFDCPQHLWWMKNQLGLLAFRIWCTGGPAWFFRRFHLFLVGVLTSQTTDWECVPWSDSGPSFAWTSHTKRLWNFVCSALLLLGESANAMSWAGTESRRGALLYFLFLERLNLASRPSSEFMQTRRNQLHCVKSSGS